MISARRVWLPVLAAAVVAGLIGPARGAVTAAAPLAAARTEVTRTITIPAGAFFLAETNEGMLLNRSGYLYSVDDDAELNAALNFEVPDVTIKKIRLYGQNHGMGLGFRAELWRVNQATGTRELMAVIDEDRGEYTAVSTLDYGGSFRTVSEWTQTTFDYRRVGPNHGAFLYVWVPATYRDHDLYAYFFGAKITYTYESTP